MTFTPRLFLPVLLAVPALVAQTIQPPFNISYSYTDLGSVPGVPPSYGGITFKANDPSRLLIGGGANGSAGVIYEVAVTRNPSGRVTGFSGTATQFSTAPNIDGGLFYGPGGVLFFTMFPNGSLGQIRPGSTTPDRIVDLLAAGVAGSVGAANITPAGFPNPGMLRIASYGSGNWYDATLTADGNGTYDVTGVSPGTFIGSGPEGLMYVPPGSSLIPDYSYVIISEYGGGNIVLYQIDAQGRPIPTSRVVFMNGIGGAEGACIDPITGDFFFSTFGGGDRVISVQGFGVCGSFITYGAGGGGTTIPQIGGGGCAGRGQQAEIRITGGVPSAFGVMVGGFQRFNQPILNMTLLAQPFATFFHPLDTAGAFTLPAQLPIDPFLSGLHVYFQSFYLDANAPLGVTGTAGLDMTVR
ncbi:MAG: hypothetical protein IPK26_09965 [Planctomycetes bacterium]|nr:hypothetical protein [Planctomycetota bacterium]